MSVPAPRKFAFETVFDDAGDVLVSAPIRKAFYTADEVERIRAEAHEEGRRLALDEAERAELECLEDVRGQLAQALTVLARAAHDHRSGAAELALACARKIADAALELFPEAAAKAALEGLLVEVQGHPRLLVRASGDAAVKVQAALEKAAEAGGYPGQVSVRADAALSGAAFVFEWGEGKAAFDPDAAAARIKAALDAALAAEGLHAEPLSIEADHG